MLYALPSDLTTSIASDDVPTTKKLYSSLIASDRSKFLNILIEMAILAAKSNQPSTLSWCFSKFPLMTPHDTADFLTRAACESPSVKVFQVLLDNGWDVNHWIEGLGSALVVACDHGDVAVAQLLLERGANPNSRYPPWLNGEAAVCAVAGDNPSLEVLSLLLKHGYEPKGTGVLIAAAEYGNLEAVELLVGTGKFDLEEVEEDGGIDPRKRADMGTALYQAILKGFGEIAVFLVDRGARIEFREEYEGKVSVRYCTQD